MPVLDDNLFLDIRLHVHERLVQHTDNLRLWETGVLTPTEPDEHERNAVIRELRAAIAELKLITKMWGLEVT